MALTATWALPRRLPLQVLVDFPAGRAGLAARIRPVRLHHQGAIPFGLVADLAQKRGHAGVAESLGLQPGPDHPGHIQGLDAQGCPDCRRLSQSQPELGVSICLRPAFAAVYTCSEHQPSNFTTQICMDSEVSQVPSSSISEVLMIFRRSLSSLSLRV